MIGNIKTMKKSSTYTNLERKEKVKYTVETLGETETDNLLGAIEARKSVNPLKNYCKKLNRSISVKLFK